MKIVVDSNSILCIEDQSFLQGKEYDLNVSGYRFHSYDKGLVVLHKKDFKLIHLKNFGDGMNLVFVKDFLGSVDFDKECFLQAFGLFAAFDEQTGKKRFFVSHLGADRVSKFPLDVLNKNFGLHLHLLRESTNLYIDGASEYFGKLSTLNEILSFLFGLVILAGKFESKGKELLSLKIQIPLMGQYLKYQEDFDRMIVELQQFGLFLKKDSLKTNNGIVYQISTNDWELLEIFGKWYEGIEKFEKITKRDFTQEMKLKLIDFLDVSQDIPLEGKDIVLSKINSGVIKFLMK